MEYKRDIVLLMLFNIAATVVSIVFIIHGQFKTNYGLEYFGIVISIVSLILIKKEKDSDFFKEPPSFYNITKILSCSLIIINGVFAIAHMIISTIHYPHFFWWQNFLE